MAGVPAWRKMAHFKKVPGYGNFLSFFSHWLGLINNLGLESAPFSDVDLIT